MKMTFSLLCLTMTQFECISSNDALLKPFQIAIAYKPVEHIFSLSNRVFERSDDLGWLGMTWRMTCAISYQDDLAVR